MLTIDQNQHIKTIKFSGDYNEYKKDYSDYTGELRVYQDFIKNYMPLRNLIRNYFDKNILDKISVYNKFVLEKSAIAFDLSYEIKFIDVKYFMDAFDQKQNKKLETMPDVLKKVLIANYNNAVKINEYEKRPDVDVIKPTYTDAELDEFKSSLFELFPELKTKQNSK